MQQVPFAYRMYTRTDEIGWAQSTAFKKAFSVDVDIEFIGVWDTVSSVGMIPKRLPFTTSNTAVKTFRHAVGSACASRPRRGTYTLNLSSRLRSTSVARGSFRTSTTGRLMRRHTLGCSMARCRRAPLRHSLGSMA